MNPSLLPEMMVVAKYVAVFAIGSLFGAALLFYFGWRFLTDYGAGQGMHDGMDSYWLAKALSHLRMDETAEATTQLEFLLDSKICRAGFWLRNTPKRRTLVKQTQKLVVRRLGMVKWYREIVPASSKVGFLADEVLVTIPALSHPTSVPELQLSAIGKFWQRHRK